MEFRTILSRPSYKPFVTISLLYSFSIFSISFLESNSEQGLDRDEDKKKVRVKKIKNMVSTQQMTINVEENFKQEIKDIQELEKLLKDQSKDYRSTRKEARQQMIESQRKVKKSLKVRRKEKVSFFSRRSSAGDDRQSLPSMVQEMMERKNLDLGCFFKNTESHIFEPFGLKLQPIPKSMPRRDFDTPRDQPRLPGLQSLPTLHNEDQGIKQSELIRRQSLALIHFQKKSRQNFEGLGGSGFGDFAANLKVNTESNPMFKGSESKHGSSPRQRTERESFDGHSMNQSASSPRNSKYSKSNAKKLPRTVKPNSLSIQEKSRTGFKNLQKWELGPESKKITNPFYSELNQKLAKKWDIKFEFSKMKGKAVEDIAPEYSDKLEQGIEFQEEIQKRRLNRLEKVNLFL